MNITTISNPQETFGNAKLQSIALSENHVKLLIDNKVVYECTDVTDCDMWDSFEYEGKQFDLHIYFCEDIEDFDNLAEWLSTCSIEICGLEEVNGTLQCSYDYSLVAPMSFAFDPMTLFKESSTKECSECGNEYHESEGRPFKYEPCRWVCNDCHDELMADAQAMESE